MRVENLEHEEVEGSAEALFLRRASEVESGKVGMSAPRGGRKRKILQKKVRRDSKKVGESTSLFRDTEIGSVHSNEEKKKKKKKREEGSPRPVDLGREVTGDHEDGVLNSEGKRRFSQRLTSVGSAFNRVSNKVLRKMTGFGTSRKGSPGSNSSEEAGEEDEEGEALIAQDQRCSTDNDSQHHATSSPVASERELRGSGSSRQTLYSPCSSPAETMPLTPSYTRDDGGPLEPCPTKMPPSQPLRDHLDDDEAFFPHYDQALPSSSPHPHRSHYAPSPSPSPLTSTTKPTPSTPNQHPETPPHLRPRLSGNQTPLTNTQYAQMIQLSLFHAQRTGAYCEEEISPAYRLAPANVTKAGDQRKSAEIWRLRVEAEGRADGGGGIVGLSEEEGKAGGGRLAAAVSRRRISLRRLLPGRK
ncbi:hypothetical protein KC354_g16968 [Hortaea werneckii]|nr:hypothetical protein KC354_g16968 [Hortaea werneckii]